MKTIFSLLLILTAIIVVAQTTELEENVKTNKADTVDGWKKGGMLSLNFSQVSLSKWAAGGQNSMSFNGMANLFANYTKGKSSWDNTLDLGYGVIKQFNSGESDQVDWIKSDDKIDFASKYGQSAFKNWYYAGMINFRTQMTAGYDYPSDTITVKISDLFAPAYLLGAIGMDYKPSDNFSLFISPLTNKTTFVNDQNFADAGAFGVDPAEYDDLGLLISHGKKIRYELGGYLKIAWKKDIMENITLSTKADFFTNYMEDNPQVDINWETIISMKINKYISATLMTHLIYDNDINIAWTDKSGNSHIGATTQFKEVFGLGFSYKF